MTTMLANKPVTLSQVKQRLKTPPQTFFVEYTEITPDVAAEMLKHNLKNRKLNKSRVKMYVEMMKRGAWVMNGDPIRFDVKGRLIDGQHKLYAIVGSGMTFCYVVEYGLEEKVQNHIDVGGKRTLGNALDMDGYQHATALGGAVRMIWQVLEDNTPSQWNSSTEATYDEYIDMVASDQLIIDSVEVALGVKKQHEILVSATAAAYYVCASNDLNAANDFFADLEAVNTANPIIKPLQAALAKFNARTKGSVARRSQVILYTILVDAFIKSQSGKPVGRIRVPQAMPQAWLVP